MNHHEKYMKRCLELGVKGFGQVAPNPMVGCVIVHDGKVIGEGYHQQYGKGHAEVDAINSVGKRDVAKLKQATLYVNLEPCSHFGKTPPCADLIIRTGFKYVVIGTLDPNPLVAGRGIQKLISAGVDVKLGVLEEECRELNKRFFTFFENARPYVILKWAETSDGYIGVEDATGKRGIQISGPVSQKLVHRWRAEEQAIIVGTKTAMTDNPQLTVRLVRGKSPVRVFIDRKLIVPSGYHLLDGKVPTIVFTTRKKSAKRNIEYVTIDFEKDLLKQILSALYKRNIQSLLVEGGAKLHNAFIQTGLWDEARIFTSKKTLSQIAGKKAKGVEAPRAIGRIGAKKRWGSDELLLITAM